MFNFITLHDTQFKLYENLISLVLKSFQNRIRRKEYHLKITLFYEKKLKESQLDSSYYNKRSRAWAKEGIQKTKRNQLYKH